MPMSPIISSCLLSVTINCISNYIAQRLKAWKDDVPFVFDYVLFFQLSFMAILTTPINYYWQGWLERTFPGYTMTKQKREATNSDAEKEVFLREDGEDKKMVEEEVSVRNWRNVFYKWFTDCITMGALLNTSMFLILMGIMKRKGWGEIGTDLKVEMWPIIWDSYKVWPIANFFSTAYCPVERRIVFLSFCGLIWSIYMSLVAARL